MSKRVILAGGGHAHLAVLADWALNPLPDSDRWLVSSSSHTAYSGMLPGWLAGHYRAEELMIDLEPMAARAGAKLIVTDAIGIDTRRNILTLASGQDIAFDLLSLATGGEADVAALAALGDRVLPIRPVPGFMAGWTSFLETQSSAASISVAIVGGGAAGVEIALAVASALDRRPGTARVALVTPQDGFLAGHSPRVRKAALAQLAGRGVEVHFARATGREGALWLSNGAALNVDCVIAATGSRAPAWLASSGLACTPSGFVAVGADMRSTSHPAIFAAGDIIERVDRRLERSGVHAVKAGPVLAANLRAAISGTKPSRYQPRRRTLYLLALGNRRAILSWGGFMAIGRWVWRLKDWIDRRFVARHSPHPGTRTAGTLLPLTVADGTAVDSDAQGR
ncbi:FAD-dependent oxidoreductase [Sphingomonas lacunae]|uniref:FAD-dependent oxidoreductase n=1 Tax=Sphingomonas lacunae TaxID=2698828 RepID=A0A6M4AY09_9SPHN|nr:FAD-dependent oxidoreductase [Sphingomonas lacunae]QJQ32929.1 FAD-dependent oxidoreductase [Sphingomonas lacunae]